MRELFKFYLNEIKQYYWLFIHNRVYDGQCFLDNFIKIPQSIKKRKRVFPSTLSVMETIVKPGNPFESRCTTCRIIGEA